MKKMMSESENIKYVDGIRIIRLYDGSWYCLFNDYRTYKTSKMECYSLNSFESWCNENNVISIK